MSKVIKKQMLLEAARVVSAILPNDMMFTILVTSFDEKGQPFSQNHISNGIDRDEVFYYMDKYLDKRQEIETSVMQAGPHPRTNIERTPTQKLLDFISDFGHENARQHRERISDIDRKFSITRHGETESVTGQLLIHIERWEEGKQRASLETELNEAFKIEVKP